MSKIDDIEKTYISDDEEYIRQKAIGGFSCTYDFIPGSEKRKRRKCTMDEIAVLRTVRIYDTETERQLATRLGKSEDEIKTIIATLLKEGMLHRTNYNGQGYWELVY